MAHRPDHLDELDVCDCDCSECTYTVDDDNRLFETHVCICELCDQERCGLHLTMIDPDERLYSL